VTVLPLIHRAKVENYDRAKRSGLQKLAQLHVDLAAADKKWLGAITAARKVNALIACIDEFWLDLPQNREPILEASERTSSRMKIIIAACAHDKQMNHSFATRTLLRDTLDDFCIAIATYCAGFNDD
jgi:hypothetical protein